MKSSPPRGPPMPKAEAEIAIDGVREHLKNISCSLLPHQILRLDSNVIGHVYQNYMQTYTKRVMLI